MMEVFSNNFNNRVAERGRNLSGIHTSNRDRGGSHLLAPPTPPYRRVRIRRFSKLSPDGPEVRVVVRHKGFAALQVSVSASPSSEPVKLSRSCLAWRSPPMRSTFYYSLSPFGPSSLG